MSLVAWRLDRLRLRCWAAITGIVVPFIIGAAADLFVLAGVGAISYGLGLIYRPLFFIVVGLVLIAIGLRGLHAKPGADA